MESSSSFLPISPSSLQLRSLYSALPNPSSYFPMPVVESDVESDKTLWDLYERWMTHCKVCRSLDEKNKRFVAFKEHVKYIHLENKTDNFPYKLELNKYSDMTTEEYESTNTTMHSVRFKHLDIHDSDVKSDKTLLRLYKLWMTRYRVSRSPNEKLKRFVTFKEQVNYIHFENKREDIIYKLGLNPFSDTTREEFESKHMGTSPAEVLIMYSKIMESGGVLLDEDYRPRNMDGSKKTLDGYGMVPTNDEDALEEAVNKHPIMALIDSRGDAFKNYRGGVLTEEPGKELVFVVTIVGYGVTPFGVKFWEIKNSWGPTWGECGFMRMKRGVNLRGIASFASYPIINTASVKA